MVDQRRRHGSLFAQRDDQPVNEERQITLFAPALSEKRDYLENSAQPGMRKMGS